MPPLAEITTACSETNETKVCAAATTLADLTDAQRTEFNTKFAATIDTLVPFVAAGFVMDHSMNETIQTVLRSGNYQAPIAQFVGKLLLPITHR